MITINRPRQLSLMADRSHEEGRKEARVDPRFQYPPGIPRAA